MEACLLLLSFLPQIDLLEVSDLVRPLSQERTALFGSHVLLPRKQESLATSFQDSFLGEPAGFPPVSRGALEEILRRISGSGGVFFEFIDGTLVVRGSPAVQERIRAAVGEISLALSPILLEVSIVEPPPGFEPTGTILTPEETRAVASWRTITRGTLPVYPGSTVSLSHREERSIVRDYDVEVAERSMIADPVVARVLSGFGLDVRAYLLSDRRVHLTVLADRAALLEVREVATEATRIGAIEIPRIGTHAVASTISVPDGATAVIGSEGGNGGTGFLVCLRPLLPAARPPHSIRALSVGLLADAGGRLPPSVGDRLEGSDEDEETPFPATIPASRFLEWLRESIGGPEYEEAFGRDGLAVAASPGLVVTAGAPGEAVEGALAFLRALESGPSRAAGLVVEVLDSTGQPASRALLSLTQGRSAAAAIGLETTTIADYSPEIASKASISDPVVEPEFAGLLVLATALSIEPGRLFLDLDLRVRTAGPERRIPPTAENVGVLTEIPVTRTAFRRRVTLRPGEPLDLGPVPASDGSTGSARVRWVAPR